MTKVQLDYDFARPLIDGDAKGISDAHSWYGILRVQVSPSLDKLTVEYDASRRAKIILGELGIVRQGDEARGVNKVLDSAALTYVAAFLATLFHLVRFWLIMQSDRGRD